MNLLLQSPPLTLFIRCPAAASRPSSSQMAAAAAAAGVQPLAANELDNEHLRPDAHGIYAFPPKMKYQFLEYLKDNCTTMRLLYTAHKSSLAMSPFLASSLIEWEHRFEQQPTRLEAMGEVLRQVKMKNWTDEIATVAAWSILAFYPKVRIGNAIAKLCPTLATDAEKVTTSEEITRPSMRSRGGGGNGRHAAAAASSSSTKTDDQKKDSAAKQKASVKRESANTQSAKKAEAHRPGKGLLAEMGDGAETVSAEANASAPVVEDEDAARVLLGMNQDSRESKIADPFQDTNAQEMEKENEEALKAMDMLENLPSILSLLERSTCLGGAAASSSSSSCHALSYRAELDALVTSIRIKGDEHRVLLASLATRGEELKKLKDDATKAAQEVLQYRGELAAENASNETRRQKMDLEIRAMAAQRDALSAEISAKTDAMELRHAALKSKISDQQDILAKTEREITTQIMIAAYAGTKEIAETVETAFEAVVEAEVRRRLHAIKEAAKTTLGIQIEKPFVPRGASVLRAQIELDQALQSAQVKQALRASKRPRSPLGKDNKK